MVAALTGFWPDKLESDWAYTSDLAVTCGALAVALAFTAFAGVRFAVLQRLQRLFRWLLALALSLAAWEAVTAKLGLLPVPFFPPPQAIVEVVIDDWERLAAGIFASARLLATGYFLGAAAGFVTGVAIGWLRLAGYWIHPVLRFVGPLPAGLGLLRVSEFWRPAHVLPALLRPAAAFGGAGADQVALHVGKASEAPTPVSLLYPPNRQLAPRVRVFIDWLVHAFDASRG
jgi:hypothetical protein